MRFDYYDNLSARQQRIYRDSDAVTEVQLSNVEQLARLADEVREALETEKVKPVQRATARLCRRLMRW